MKYAVIIQKQRNKLGLSQEELAKQIGVAPARIQKWESGEVLPNLLQVPFLCAALQLSYDDFFSTENKKKGKQHRKTLPASMYQLSYLPVMCNHTMHYYRMALHMTTQDFANQCSVSEALVKKWESGRSIPSLDVIPVICSVLQIKIWQFFE